MDESTLVLFGGLVGSIATVGVGKIIDLIQKKQEHEYSLQKMFFEKKLRVTEDYVNYLQNSINALLPLIYILQNVQKRPLSIFNKATSAQFVESLSRLKKISEEKDNKYMAGLYYDLSKMGELDSRFTENVLEIMTRLNEKTEALRSETAPEKQSQLREDIFQEIAFFADMLEKGKKDMNEMISQCRESMKQFER
jgi:hypothetical protein